MCGIHARPSSHLALSALLELLAQLIRERLVAVVPVLDLAERHAAQGVEAGSHHRPREHRRRGSRLEQRHRATGDPRILTLRIAPDLALDRRGPVIGCRESQRAHHGCVEHHAQDVYRMLVGRVLVHRHPRIAGRHAAAVERHVRERSAGAEIQNAEHVGRGLLEAIHPVLDQPIADARALETARHDAAQLRMEVLVRRQDVVPAGLVSERRPSREPATRVGGRQTHHGALDAELGEEIARPRVDRVLRIAPAHEWRQRDAHGRDDTAAILRGEEAVVEVAHDLLERRGRVL
jgi:hypothetical protein